MARLSASSSVQSNGAPAEPQTTSTMPTREPPQPPQPTRRDSDNESFASPTEAKAPPQPVHDPSLFPTGTRSLSSIAQQAFSLGLTLGTTALLTPYLALTHNSPWWRLPIFFTCLSTFHYLEFHTTAHYNTPQARASSFLLFSNSAAYNAAHALATLEICISCAYPDTLLLRWTNAWTVVAGALLVLMGQGVRSLAMAQAGTNFNHMPARTYREGHELVTRGIYSWVRHPSYFGFFYWALGTQVLVGNKVCLLGYTVVLWRFFRERIEDEEKLLVQFFGSDYLHFRERVGTGLPWI